MVNQHTVTMTFVNSYLEQLLHSQNNMFSKHREDVFFYIVNVKVVVLVETVDLVLD